VEQSVFSIHLPHGLKKLWVLSMALICVEAPISATWYLFIGGFSSQPWLYGWLAVEALQGKESVIAGDVIFGINFQLFAIVMVGNI
ncbi:hypothetical protein, partial [Klebsiella pneumoniae]|uniref:hypothetical protein n=1 Tax=Klebsiella pneumoniae TaxID=573 RepID=UPI0015F2C5C0